MKVVLSIGAVAVFYCASGVLWAQDSDCKQISATADMARASTMSALAQAKKRAGENYRTDLVFAYRSFQLNPHSEVKGERLLTLLPKNDPQQTTVMTLGDSLCDAENLADMEILSRVYEGFAKELTRAVLLVPRLLPAYLTYATTATQDSHSDYAVQMRRVCRLHHRGFLQSLKQLPLDQQQSFTKYVMNPDGCRILALPEAE